MSLRDMDPDDFSIYVHVADVADALCVVIDRHATGSARVWLPLPAARELRDQLISAIANIEDRPAREASAPAAVGDGDRGET